MTGSWLEMKSHLRVPGPFVEQIADLTRQCLSTFCCSILSLTSKLQFRRIGVPTIINWTQGWTLKSDKPGSPVGEVHRWPLFLSHTIYATDRSQSPRGRLSRTVVELCSLDWPTGRV